MPVMSSLYALTPFLDAIRPSKSPHLVASAISVVSLIWMAHQTNSEYQVRFWSMSIVVLIALAGVIFFSFQDVIDEQDEDIENHFKFARAMGIGSAIFALALSGKLIDEDATHQFILAYVAAVIQLLTFMTYSVIRLFKKEMEKELKIFGIS